MPRFACPHCKNVLTARDDERGCVILCSECEKKIRVPASKPGSKPAQAIQTLPSSPKSKPAARPMPPPLVSTENDFDKNDFDEVEIVDDAPPDDGPGRIAKSSPQRELRKPRDDS